LAQNNAFENPYFVALRDGTFAREDFVETQIQFFHAVSFFNRPLAALAAGIPDAQRRMGVVRNIWEEHGEGEHSLFHEVTFLQLLERLDGITRADVHRRFLWPEVKTFNTTLMGAAATDTYRVGAACLGIVERMFADISAWIGQGMVDRGWLAEDQVVHYRKHQELDVRHAEDLLAVVRPEFDGGFERRYEIAVGLRMGALCFNQLFEGLHRARERRIFI